jgi:putative transposase
MTRTHVSRSFKPIQTHLSNRGRICLEHKKINSSQVFAGQAIGIKEVHDDIWLVSFMDYDLGYFDLETRVLEPLENPFGPKCYGMS